MALLNNIIVVELLQTCCAKKLQPNILTGSDYNRAHGNSQTIQLADKQSRRRVN